MIDQSIYASHGGYDEAISHDGGRSWSYAQNIADDIAQQMSQPVTLPLMVCVQEDPRICYRITGEERVEGSQDGGQTWQVVWQLPPGRRRFMEAYNHNRLSICGTVFDPGPYDLALLTTQDGEHNLIVAVVSRMLQMRPARIPSALGLSYWHIAYRLHACADLASNRTIEGLYFLRSDVDRSLPVIPGNALTDFRFHKASIRSSADGALIRFNVTETLDQIADAEVVIETAPAGEIEISPPFGTISERKRILRYAPFGLSVDLRLYLREKTVRRLNRQRKPGQRIPFRSKNSLKTRLGLSDFRVRAYQAVDKHVVVALLTWAYVERFFEQVHCAQIKTFGDLIRRHRDEHAVERLTGAIRMMQEIGDLHQVLKRYLRLETIYGCRTERNLAGRRAWWVLRAGNCLG